MTEAPVGGRGNDVFYPWHHWRCCCVVVCGCAFLLHNDDVVESTTSRPLHTVGTTVAAEAEGEISDCQIYWETFQLLTFGAQKHDAISV